MGIPILAEVQIRKNIQKNDGPEAQASGPFLRS
jgi:hypothetical protein